MRPHVLPLGGCIGLFFVGVIVFVIGLAITENTGNTEAALWTRSCALTEDAGNVSVACGDHVQKISAEKPILSALSGRSISIECTGYPARGLGLSIILDCPLKRK